MINGRLVDRWSGTGLWRLAGHRQGYRCGWYWMSTGASVWLLDCGLVGLGVRRRELSARAKPEPKRWKKKLVVFKDGFSLTRAVYRVSPKYSDRTIFDQRETAGLGWCLEQANVRRARSRLRRQEWAISDRDVLTASKPAGRNEGKETKMLLPLAGLRLVRVNCWNREVPASWSSTSCLPSWRLLRCFRRELRLETSFPKQGRVEEQIRSRTSVKLWGRSWSVPIASINHEKVGSQPEWL